MLHKINIKNVTYKCTGLVVNWISWHTNQTLNILHAQTHEQKHINKQKPSK